MEHIATEKMRHVARDLQFIHDSCHAAMDGRLAMDDVVVMLRDCEDIATNLGIELRPYRKPDEAT